MPVIDTTESRYPVDTLQRTLDWFEEARPTPDRKQFHNQMGVHFEEVGEMLEELTGEDGDTRILLADAKMAIKRLATHLKQNSDQELIVIEEDRIVPYLDALCDQIVTAVGCAQTIDGLDIVGAMKEVNTSNFSKFVDGKAIFDATGKIQKGPNYVKARLDQFYTR